jgi:hypothetical protein
MKKVIFVDDADKDNEDVVFTHYLNSNDGKKETSTSPNTYQKIIYLGKDFCSGKDLFAAYNKQNLVFLYLGELNSGMY